jgi:hypothetical protein
MISINIRFSCEHLAGEYLAIAPTGLTVKTFWRPQIYRNLPATSVPWSVASRGPFLLAWPRPSVS